MLELGLGIGADTEVWPAEQDYCSWEGVTCERYGSECEGRVTLLQLPYSGDNNGGRINYLLSLV